MENYSYYCPVEIVYGKDIVKTYSKYTQFGKKCTVITGMHMFRHSSVITDLSEALERSGIEYTILAEAENNPTVNNAFDLANKTVEAGSDFIIGVGGGSSMDAAKAAALIAANPEVLPDEIFSYNNWKKPLPSIMIGTTAGTGSEVMPSAVLTVGTGTVEKRSLKTHDSYAKVALCDPQYTKSMPDAVTVSTAIDAVCHAIEAYYSKKAVTFTKLFALEAIKKASPALSDFVNGSRSDQTREALYYASILAGLAINGGGTSFPHSMGYMLTTMHGIPHGYACSAFIAEFLRRISKISDITPVLDAFGSDTLDEFKETVSRYTSEYIKYPPLSENEIKAFASAAMTMSVNNNFLNLTENDCIDIYRLLA